MDAVTEGIPGNYNGINGATWRSQIGFRRSSKSKQESKANNPVQPIYTNPTCLKNAWYYFQIFSDNVSISGLKFLAEKGRTLPERIFWAAILTFSLAITGLLIWQTINRFISSPAITFATSELSIHEIPFPAITICPEVKSNKDLFNYTDVLLRKAKNLTLTLEESKNFGFMSVVCDTPSKLLDENMTLSSQELFDFLWEVTPDFHVSVLKFDWRGNESNTRDLFSPILTSEGICYTFNMLDRSDLFDNNVQYEDVYFSSEEQYTQWSLENGYPAESTIDNAYPRRTSMAGVEGGLSIELKVFKRDLDYACGDSLQGFKVKLHQPEEFPRVQQNYFRIPLDQSVVAAVKPNMMTTSGDLRGYFPQNRKCFFSYERKLQYFNLYNQQNCLVECLANYTIASCGCVNFYMPRNECTPICSAAKKECMENARIMFLKTEVDNDIKQARNSKLTRINLDSVTVDFSEQCQCFPSCNSLDFDVETSQSDWEWEEAFKINKEINDDFMIFDNSRIKAARFRIYFKDMQFLNSERNQLYSADDFWANVGGIVGWYMGFSFVTLFEVLYYLSLRLCCNVKMFGRHVWSGAPELSVKD